MHIDDYRFGKIVIDGQTYSSDVIIYPDKVDPSWWRKEGHNLQEADIMKIVSAKPDILVIGTGNSGVMRVPEKTKKFIESNGIKVYIEKTVKAVEIFNRQPADKKTAGAFHLTC